MMTFNGRSSQGPAFAAGMLPNIAASGVTISYQVGSISMMLCEWGIRTCLGTKLSFRTHSFGLGSTETGPSLGTKVGLVNWCFEGAPNLMKPRFGKLQFEQIFPNQRLIGQKKLGCHTLLKFSKIFQKVS